MLFYTNLTLKCLKNNCVYIFLNIILLLYELFMRIFILNFQSLALQIGHFIIFNYNKFENC